MKFKLYFELYGKKFCTTVEAQSELEAKCTIRNKIEFHKVEKIDESYDDLMDGINNSPLGDIFKGFGKNK